jgi:[ribosomal protein S5]-alanine N-acetyltransferase
LGCPFVETLVPGPVFLDGDRIALRTIEESDLEFLQSAVVDPRVRRPIGTAIPLNADQERAFFETVVSDEETVQLLVTRAEDGTPVGTVGLDPIDERAGVAEVGYWIAPEHWEKGYGSEATALIVRYAFDQLRLHKVTARVFEFNEGSKRLLKSVGFTAEGIQREQAFIDGEYQDCHWYGLLAPEWDG